jgi:hypothetical protein
LLSLAAVSTVVLWPVAISGAWDWCPVQSCDFWQNVCQIGGGDWDLDYTGLCLKEDNNFAGSFRATCTPPNQMQAPWSVDCVPD